MNPAQVIPRFLAHEVSDWDQLLVADTQGDRHLNAVSAQVINLLSAVGVGELTLETAEDAWLRVAVFQAIHGPFLAVGPKQVFLTRSDLLRHVGVRVETREQLTTKEFMCSLAAGRVHPEGDALPLAANGGTSALRLVGIPERAS